MKKFAFIFYLSLCFCGFGFISCTNTEPPIIYDDEQSTESADEPSDIGKIPAMYAYISQIEPGDEYSYVGFGFEHAGAHLKNRPKIIDDNELSLSPSPLSLTVKEIQKTEIKKLSQVTEHAEIASDITLPVYRLSDVSEWKGSAPAVKITGDTITLSNAPGAVPAAVYMGKEIGNELVEFKLKLDFGAGDNWVAVRFRSNAPENNIWDNANIISILIRENVVSLFSIKNGKSSSEFAHVSTDVFGSGQELTVLAGAYDKDGKTYVYLKADDTVILNTVVIDGKAELSQSYVSFNLFGEATAQVTVFSNGENDSGFVERPLVYSEKNALSDNSLWYVNQGADADMQKFAAIEKSENGIRPLSKLN